MKHKTGRCGCGQVTYAYSGTPINTVFCYCKQCQIHTGSDKWFGIWIPKSNFGFIKGITSVYSRISDSGQPTKYHFCKNCGTTVCAEIVVGNFYSIAASTLDDKDTLAPAMLIYTAYAPPWATMPEDVPSFDILPPFLTAQM
jgi:hypothetical protein